MRDFLNNILSFIGQTSLTDTEFGTVEASFTVLDQNTYDDLASILQSRNAVTKSIDRLTWYYKAGGFDPVPVKNTSNIYVGSGL